VYPVDMTYLIIVTLLTMSAPAAIWLAGRVVSCGLSMVAALGHLTAALLFALADLLDRRRRAPR
jgi:predicted membrane protein